MTESNGSVPGFYLSAGAASVIGLSGKAGSGKTEVARFLARTFGFTSVALADAFKVPCVVRHGMPIAEVFGSAKSPATRHALQQEGTERGRMLYGEDIWPRTLEAQMYGMVQAGVTRFTVCDVRFDSELAWIHRLGGNVYRLVGRGGTQGQEHVSETALDHCRDFDAVFDNAPGREADFWEDVTCQVFQDYFRSPGFDADGSVPCVIPPPTRPNTGWKECIPRGLPIHDTHDLCCGPHAP